MKKICINIIVCAIAMICVRAEAQTVSTFENINLGTDSVWNGSDWSGGFINGNADFVNHYDTSFGYVSWDGFAVSEKNDSVTPGYANQYSAITGSGFNSSKNYAVVYFSGFDPVKIKLNGSAKGKQVSGFYITNSTYAYRDMKNGSSFSKKFGGPTGNDPDWYKIKIKGYRNGGKSADSTIEFYLADLRFADNSKDYILKKWTWVDLTAMGNVDSLQFDFSSSDTGTYGMNTPAYFCMDNFTTKDAFAGIVSLHQSENSMLVYPNPAKDFIVVDGDGKFSDLIILDMTGREMMKQPIVRGEIISISTLPPGVYFLQINGDAKQQTKKLIIE